jgi:hypothetical protein
VIGVVRTTPLTFRDYVGAGDAYDFYKITVKSNSLVNFTFTADTPAGVAQPSSGFTAGLALYATDGTTQIGSTEFPTTGTASLAQGLGLGTYYLKVDNPSLNNIGTNYTLSISGTPTSGAVTPATITAALLPPAGAIEFIDTSVEAQAGRLYQAAFGRAPDDAGVSFWAGQIHAGASLADVATQFLASQEFQTRFGSPDNATFVSELYQNVLGRAGEPAGIAFWQNQLDTNAQTRAQVLVSFSESPENQATTPLSANAQSAARLFWAELGRAPDSAGLTFWTSQLSNGSATLVQEADSLANSSEFTTRFPNLDNAGFVNQLYQNVLGRAPDAAGSATWTDALANGASRGSVVTSFSESPEAKARFDSLVGQFGIVVTP